MKTKLIIALSLLILKSTLSFSQKDSSGIYCSSDDFIKQKLSFAINCNTEKHKIKSQMIFHPRKVSIKHADLTYTYPKDSIYGIKKCDGSILRVYNSIEYPLINPGEKIMIYKLITRIRAKVNPNVISYHFSKDAESKIQDLTISNIKAAFPDNHKFHDLIDTEFHNNKELTLYDTTHKIMKVNRILQNSLKND